MVLACWNTAQMLFLACCSKAWQAVTDTHLSSLQLCQMAADSPDIVVMKVDFDENRDIVKPLAIKVCTAPASLLFAVSACQRIR